MTIHQVLYDNLESAAQAGADPKYITEANGVVYEQVFHLQPEYKAPKKVEVKVEPESTEDEPIEGNNN